LGVGALRSAVWPRGIDEREAKAVAGEAAYPHPRIKSGAGSNPLPPAGEGAKRAGALRSAYLQGVITNAFNPKVAVFYLAFLPQFMRAGDDIALKSVLLIGIHYALGLLWLSSVALFVVQFNTWLRRSVVQRVLEGTVGAVMTLFGVKLALAAR
jgi:threonine/homoserine/homoserine lactone efflux protein